METLLTLSFDQPGLGLALDRVGADGLDALDFGVIGFDADDSISAYNRHESEAAGLTVARVAGKSLFAEVAPCMNNFLVAERFHEARAAQVRLDATIDYVLTLRMRPTRVRLRLIHEPSTPRSWVLVRRLVAATRAIP